MDRGIPKTKRIGELKQGFDLANGERAVPESDVVWLVCKPNGKVIENEVVLCVYRVGNEVIASTEQGRYPLTGEEDHTLKPMNKKFYNARIKKKDRNRLGYIPKPH